ncbi:sialate O-acetylesterase [Fulvivirgaceae bacterium BMA12]|uniref:Sialate O-acetylesterase n=1 Tax=Agaribacillus aureus TaxID=3051825 RepID=A0ABT8KZC5_9BACT|nr:sialate O-acetylesterase [Fulvivirgaceae bacterium BMA12]
MNKFSLLCLLIMFSLNQPLLGQLKIAEIFTDNMVLQRNQTLKVWGWSRKNDRITVRFKGKDYSGKSNKSGKWIVELPSMEAGGPFEMSIKNASEKINLSNILVGDVWLCSGQSNMAWTVENSNNASGEIARANDEMIRHFKVPLSWSKEAELHLDSSAWEVSNPENTGDFTAVGYYFARELRKEIDVPIGLLNASWGGSRIEPWMSPESLQPYFDGDIDAFLLKREKENEAALKKTEDRVAQLLAKTRTEGLHLAEFDDSLWETMKMPGFWENAGYPGMDGLVLIRKVFILSKAEAEKDISLHLGAIDDSDWTYVNGELVGSLKNQWNVPRNYTIQPSLLKEGKNVVVIRIQDTGGAGGLSANPEDFYYKSMTGKTSLSGEWKLRVEEVTKLSGPGFSANNAPIVIYNKMIHPILDFPIKGAIWYQGESNATADDAYRYRELFAAMITDWRTRWRVGNFPFLWVQLANYRKPDAEPSENDWAVLRESQSTTLSLPNTGQAVTIDVGEADDIHPRNKQDVGYRLALAARKMAYDEDLVYSGPVYKSMEKKGQSILVNFDHIGSGLMAKDKYGYLKGFAICGQDKAFKWAKARIEGDRIRVWSDDIQAPQHIRYAWGINPDDANLYNKEGLPAGPFRTDK